MAVLRGLNIGFSFFWYLSKYWYSDFRFTFFDSSGTYSPLNTIAALALIIPQLSADVVGYTMLVNQDGGNYYI